MRKTLLAIVFFYGTFQALHSQDKRDGVSSFSLPVRNSLKFNRFLINPTFSFVKEQSTYLSFYNKRQWVQFDDAPQTYLFGYSGRFAENGGMAVGLFQQNYGVLTTFGAITNFSQNIRLQEDSNLTFGMNVGFYKSGLNRGKVITNVSDPSLESIPSNTLITINPGINYGTAFLDFGVSVNNLVLYNLKTSKIVEDDPGNSVEAHIMYTGYLDTYGHFYKSKFSALIKSEFKKDKTVVSGLMMFAIPSGVWAQAGYNSVYGISAGMGLNITPKISLEYNFEKGTGNLSNFGSSHEIVLAYKFKNKTYYYGDDEEEEGSLIPPAERRYVPVKSKESSILSPIDVQRLREPKQDLIAKKEQKIVRRLKEIAEAKARAKADSLAQVKARAVALAQVKLASDAKVKTNTPVQTKPVAQTKAKLEVPFQAKPTVTAQAKLAAKVKADSLAQTRLATLPNDVNARLMDNLAKLKKGVKNTQQELLKKLDITVANKGKDHKDLKEKNDLSEKGIFRAPKPFKSVTAENKALEPLKSEITELNNSETQKIKRLESLRSARIKKVSNKNDEFNQFYLKTIEQLKAEQLITIQLNQTLISSLEKINTEAEIKKKRRIKRAAFENDQERYLKDRATLSQIKEKTPYSEVPLKSEDFDYGEEQSFLQILRNIKNLRSGYYLILAVHQNSTKRDQFLTKTVAAGQSNVDFFYDVTTSKYFIYYEKFDSIDQANDALKSGGNKPYNGKMSIVKVENN
ncbi:type IX secretion system membrane protein PorP/SprF [Flavobacterium sp. LS1P28]|uniref:PorP/SprF family type IX secretion system membrane protein n=1 Tax=unclassified Flavobacterium TaxID=196869 RepID=UPI000F829549|nr:MULTISPECIES: PorP/SprF family type IX secretion system membrane protein [unclassified Flavobacterium]RTY80581.1 type IX secretion system membrane protein PorP/SprF [Flavobacterium sp. LS1P28]RTY83909.1 type IX secretion system membrane protein PorP/SprF [Flavobacterium sp. ZB4P23]